MRISSVPRGIAYSSITMTSFTLTYLLRALFHFYLRFFSLCVVLRLTYDKQACACSNHEYIRDWQQISQRKIYPDLTYWNFVPSCHKFPRLTFSGADPLALRAGPIGSRRSRRRFERQRSIGGYIVTKETDSMKLRLFKKSTRVTPVTRHRVRLSLSRGAELRNRVYDTRDAFLHVCAG